MPYRILADALLVLHLLFILFVVLGGLLTLRDRRWALLQVPALLWGATIEFMGWICPLTPLENRLRAAGDQAGYQGGFIEHYLLPVVYPPGLTPRVQYILGGLVLAINLVVYALVVRRWRQGRRPASSSR